MRAYSLIFGLAAFVGSCVTPKPETTAVTDAEALAYIPEHVKDRDGWSLDILHAITAIDKVPTPERYCAVIAVIQQESGFQVNPRVADLPKIVRAGLEKKVARLGPL